MIYKFKSQATADTIMLGPHGDAMLRLIGREPAAQGIIEPAEMPAAIDALQCAMAEDDLARRSASPDNDADESSNARDPVSLRRRLWPIVDMLKRAHEAAEPVVWGV